MSSALKEQTLVGGERDLLRLPDLLIISISISNVECPIAVACGRDRETKA